MTIFALGVFNVFHISYIFIPWQVALLFNVYRQKICTTISKTFGLFPISYCQCAEAVLKTIWNGTSRLSHSAIIINNHQRNADSLLCVEFSDSTPIHPRLDYTHYTFPSLKKRTRDIRALTIIFFHYNNHNWRLCNFYEFWVRRICDANCISLLTLEKYKFSREKSCRFMRHSRVTMSVWNWTNGLKISLRWLLISQQQRSCMEYGKIQIIRVSAAGCTHNLIQFFHKFLPTH